MPLPMARTGTHFLFLFAHCVKNFTPALYKQSLGEFKGLLRLDASSPIREFTFLEWSE